jgi:hypothetical protein
MIGKKEGSRISKIWVGFASVGGECKVRGFVGRYSTLMPYQDKRP